MPGPLCRPAAPGIHPRCAARRPRPATLRRVPGTTSFGPRCHPETATMARQEAIPGATPGVGVIFPIQKPSNQFETIQDSTKTHLENHPKITIPSQPPQRSPSAVPPPPAPPPPPSAPPAPAARRWARSPASSAAATRLQPAGRRGRSATPGEPGAPHGRLASDWQWLDDFWVIFGWFLGDLNKVSGAFWMIWIIIHGSWRIFGMKMMQKWSILAWSPKSKMIILDYLGYEENWILENCWIWWSPNDPNRRPRKS